MDTKEAAKVLGKQVVSKMAKTQGHLSTVERTASPKKETVAAKPKVRREARQPRRSPEATRDALVCRYCGSDDLAPSFKKRRDARCRACFKKRYGSTARAKKGNRASKSKARK